MSEIRYPWKRFLYRPGEGYDLGLDGFLADPEGKHASLYSRPLLTLDQCLDDRCVVLLGEPGIGKSHVLDELYRAHTDRWKTDDGVVTKFIKLSTYGDEGRLMRALFENAEFQDWEKGSESLYLFLDSFDEALVRIGPLANIVDEKLKDLSVDALNRLYLRIACRSGAWPSHFEAQLNARWPKLYFSVSEDQRTTHSDSVSTGSSKSEIRSKLVGQISVVEVAPLRRIDVQIAAEAEGLNGSAFVSEVESIRVTSLAIVPETLKLLFEFARDGQSLPPSRWKLYEEGCRRLCRENSHSRSDLPGTLTAEERMEIAGQLAAVMTFSGKHLVSLETSVADGESETLSLSGLLLSPNVGTRALRRPSRREYEEVIRDTALFSGQAPGYYAWSHKSRCEFLAAWYLDFGRVSANQIRGLLLHQDKYANPRFVETAAWMACKNREILQVLVENDPDIVLGSDPAAGPDLAKCLVDSLLTKLRDGKIDILRFSYREKYPILHHDGLCEQLARYIENHDDDFLVRRTAMDIGEVCREAGISDSLVQVILNSEELIGLRSHAAVSLAELGDLPQLERTSVLLDKPIEGDDDLELTGSLFHVLWPKVISIRQVIRHLVIPDDDCVIGMYHNFLSRDLPSRLEHGDAEAILEWLTSAPLKRRSLREYEDLARKAITFAFQQLEEARIRSLVAEALSHLALYLDSPILDEELESISSFLDEHDEIRRALLREFIRVAAKDGDITFYFPRIGKPSIYLTRDQQWLLEELPKVDVEVRETWNHFVHAVYDFQEPDALDSLFGLFEKAPGLKERFKIQLQGIDLNSDTAKRLREGLAYEKGSRLVKVRKPVEPSPSCRINDRLHEFETGILDAWWQLIAELTLEEYSAYYGHAMNANIKELPGWLSATREVRDRIVTAAKRYILMHCVNAERNFGSTTFYRADMGGYQALTLLWYEDKSFLESLDADVWNNWTPAILGFPNTSTNDDLEVSEWICKEAYEKSPDAFHWSVEKIVREQIEESARVPVINKFRNFADDGLCSVLLKCAQDLKLESKLRGEFLRVGLSTQHGPSIEHANEMLRNVPEPGGSDEVWLEVAASCMLFIDGACWELIRPIFETNEPVATQMLYRYTELQRYSGKRDQLPEISLDQMTEFYIWLAERFPHEQDPPRNRVHRLTDRDQILDLRRGILGYLKNFGTPEAISNLGKIQKSFPELKWLKWTILEAERLARKNAWVPLEPSQLVALLFDPEKRIVGSEEELLGVVLESLRRYGNELRGEIYLWYRLWDKQPGGKLYRPKEEERLSDDIAYFLRVDLEKNQVVVNREIQIHARGQHTNDRTDIKVETFQRRPDGSATDPIAVVVEVKGCWNPELFASMESQLVNRYLHDNKCSHGVYVTGWYLCDSWDGGDNKKSLAKKHGEIDSIRNRLDAEAERICGTSTCTVKSIVLDCSIPSRD